MRILPFAVAILLLIAVVSPAFAQLSPAHEEPGGGGVYVGDLAADVRALAALSALSGPAPCVGGRAADTFACQNVDLESFVALDDLIPGARSGSNLWGFVDLDDRREYAVMGVNNGTAVVEVTDAAHPRVVGSVPGPLSVWREVKVYQVWNAARQQHDAYAYVVSEAPTAGLQILDLSDLPLSVSLAGTFRGFDTAHTIFLANVDPSSGSPALPGVAPVLYIEGSNEGFLSLDVSRPTAPSITGRLVDSYVHDIWAGVFRGSRAGPCASGHETCEVVADFGGDAVRLIDFTTKSDPVVLSALRYDELGYAHSGWTSRDGRFLFAFDEGDEIVHGGKSRIRVLDISDLAHPFVAAVWTSSTEAIEHNGYVVGDRLYVSYYERGLAVLDVTDPTSPSEVGFFDTFPASDEARFHGAWGVYPFLPSGTLAVSNIDGAGGLFVLRESPAALAPPPGVPRGPVVPVAPGPRGTRRLPGSR
ncbi:MAG TPA: choice-of-anchor B family protein [Thermoanaerobaculia bacterium]|nr:choice-of-anchor B family protein [Thermoanaerobaculia bacterium]